MDFQEACRRVHFGRSILFTGAGFSFGAKSCGDKALVDADGLAEELSGSVGESEVLPLDLAADLFLEQNGRNAGGLIQKLQEHFLVKEMQPYHVHLAKMPWKRIYTTNYDNLFEEARRKEGKAPTIATLIDRPVNVLDDGTIVHFNGFVERLTRSVSVNLCAGHSERRGACHAPESQTPTP